MTADAVTARRADVLAGTCVVAASAVLLTLPVAVQVSHRAHA